MTAATAPRPKRKTSAPKKKATPEEMVEHFGSLPRGAGSPEERLKATAKYFGVKPDTILKHLRFWWPGKRYLEEFGTTGERMRPKWDRPTDELLKAMNEHGTVAKAAKALKTTAITLNKTLERHGIVKAWVLAKKG